MSNKFLAMDEWLRQLGLRHPFRSATTSSNDDINQLCDPFCWIGDLASSPDAYVVWGKPGAGKSAYRHILAQTVESNPGPEKWLVVGLYRRELATIAEQAASGGLRNENRFAALVANCAHARLAGEQGDAPAAAPAVSRAGARLEAAGTIELLAGQVQAHGYTGCLILVDEVDDVRGAKGNVQIQRELVRPLFSEWFEKPCWRWRAFLPDALRRQLTGEYAISPRVQQLSLEWRAEHLRQLIADRMLHYSAQAYETIGDLCDEELGPVIDAELIALSRSNPRAAITLASMLFRQHCQQAPIPRLIGRASWRTVCAEWEQQTHSAAVILDAPAPPPQTTPASEDTAPQRAQLRIDDGGTIWLGATEITTELNRRRFNILKLLYDKQGAVVERDEIVQAGWPPSECANPEDVSDDMIRQQINHIRGILSQETNYIENVPGRGYRLHATGFQPRKTKAGGVRL